MGHTKGGYGATTKLPNTTSYFAENIGAALSNEDSVCWPRILQILRSEPISGDNALAEKRHRT